MNEDYEDEELEELEEYDNTSTNYNGYNVRLPRSNNIAKNAKNTVQKAGKEAIKKVGTAFFNAAKKVFVTVISHPVVVGVILFILVVALIWYAISEETVKKATNNVKDYIMNSDTIDPTAKSLYEERHSLILLKLSEINEIYDKFINNKSIGGDIRNPMSIKVGANDVENKKATQSGGSGSGVGVGDYNSNFKPGSDGIRDDERVKIITGASAPISTYMTGGRYIWSDGYIGGVKVDIVDVTVPIWDINGNSSTTVVQVNVKIKEIVESIFKEIYEHPSKPAIISCGGFRANDGSPNHPFGVAIDINPDQNPFYENGQLSVGVSYNPGSDPLSMGPDHPIVQVFNKYGWDWGGNWTEPKDYMHFSFMGG